MMEAKWKVTRILGLTCCLAFLTAVSMAQMDGAALQTRTAVVEVQSADGTLIAGAVVTYRGTGGEQLLATPQGDGTYLIPNAAQKLSLHIEHPSMRPADWDTVLTELNSTVRVSVQARGVGFKLLATPATDGPFLGTTQLGTSSARQAPEFAGANGDSPDVPALLSNVAPDFAPAPAAVRRIASHPQCGEGAGDCCAEGGNGTPGCDDLDCCHCICSCDPFCCDTSWDGLCAGQGNPPGSCGAANPNGECVAECSECVPECGNDIIEPGEDCDGGDCPGGPCNADCTCPGCEVECPAGGIDEAEACGDDTNGGCNSSPPVFIEAECNTSFCGTVWADGGTRDTDWYRLTLAGGVISSTVISETQTTNFILSGIDGCGVAVVGDIGCSNDCAPIADASFAVTPGVWGVFVGTGTCVGGGIFDGVPCGSSNDYIVEITCEGAEADCGNDIIEPGEECDGGKCADGQPCNANCTCPPPLICGPGAGDCCAEGGNGTPGCDDEDCCNCICACDPFCCDVSWDGLCAGQGNPPGSCGAANPDSGCAVECSECIPECGNDIIEPGEECDGGKCADGQPCNADCTCPPAAGCECPPGTPDEAEACGDDTNGGCNSDPPAFFEAECNTSYCGTVWADGGTRDTDWYRLVVAGGVISSTVISQTQTTNFILSGIDGCAVAVVGDIGCSNDCAPIADASFAVTPGAWGVFVGTGTCAGGGIFDGVPCGGSNDYIVEITCQAGGCEDDDDCDPGEFCQDGVCVPLPPTNDFCQDAIALEVPSLTPGTTNSATFDGTAFCGTSNTAPGVWYSVTGTGNTMTASTCNMADYDTKLTVFCGDCPEGGGSDCCVANGTPGCDDPECEALICGLDPFCCDVSWDGACSAAANDLCEVCTGGGGLTCVDGNDDTGGCAGFTTELSWCSQPGAEYLLLVHGFGGATGNFDLEMTDGAGCGGAVQCIVLPPTGACCCGADCIEDSTEEDCLALMCEYQGDDTECFDLPGQSLFSNPDLPISFDLDPAVDTINVAGDDMITDVDVDLQITHTWVGDLVVTLTHGDTTVDLIVMMGDPTDTPGGGGGFGCAENNLDILLDDDGDGGAIEVQCAADLSSPPSYTPNGSLADFNGVGKGGLWTLTVTDTAGGDDGTLDGWSLHFPGEGDPIPLCGCGSDADCDDGEACTDDVCGDDGECSNTAVDCADAGDECNDASCDPEGEEGNCAILTPVADGTACGSSSDTDCDNPDTCDDAGNCQDNNEDAGTPCPDDGNECTDDECDGSGNCTHPNNTDPCDDGNACTTEDTCSDGACEGGPPLDCDDNDACTADSCDPATGCVNEDIEQTLVIKQGTCSAPVNPNSNGVIPMLLVGDVGFNVNNIVLTSLELRRCDGVGGPAAPLAEHTKVKDLNHPGDSVACGECGCNDDQSSDGLDDLSLKFRTSTTLAALLLGVGDGTVTLELTGTMNDGTPFCSRDCVTVVPPGVGNSAIAVEASVFDTFVEVGPLDLNVDSDGFSSFSRSYLEGTEVTLNAPLLSNGRRFLRWSVDGVMQPFGLRSIEVTAAANEVALMAIFERPGRLVPDRPEEDDGDLE